jgi:hypothetical protein
MTFFVTCVTLHIAQVLTFLLSRGVSTASIHYGTRIQISARPLDMAHLATLMTSPLITTGCRGTAGFTQIIVVTPPRPCRLCSVQRQLCGIPLNLFRNLTGTTNSPGVRVCKASQQLLLHLCAVTVGRVNTARLLDMCGNHG